MLAQLNHEVPSFLFVIMESMLWNNRKKKTKNKKQPWSLSGTQTAVGLPP